MREAIVVGHHMVVEGFRDIEVEDINAFVDQARKVTEGCYVQFFNAWLVADFDHLRFAVLNALRAFGSGTNISKDPALEILLYASGQHQISKAIELLGVKLGATEMAVVVVADTREKAVEALDKVSSLVGGKKCDGIIELTDEKATDIRKAFGITPLEVEATLRKSEKEALTCLLIERCALLATRSRRVSPLQRRERHQAR